MSARESLKLIDRLLGTITAHESELQSLRAERDRLKAACDQMSGDLMLLPTQEAFDKLRADRDALAARVPVVTDAMHKHILEPRDYAELRSWTRIHGWIARLSPPTASPVPVSEPITYSSTQATNCAGCGKYKHTPLRMDWMGGYVCLTCIDDELERSNPELQPDDPPDPQPATEPAHGEVVGYASESSFRSVTPGAATNAMQHGVPTYQFTHRQHGDFRIPLVRLSTLESVRAERDDWKARYETLLLIEARETARAESAEMERDAYRVAATEIGHLNPNVPGWITNRVAELMGGSNGNPVSK